MEDERRYWVNAPFGISDLFDTKDFEVDEEEKEKRKLKHIDAELESAGFFIGETEWFYKTWDKEEAIEMAKVAREIWKEWSEDQADTVSITAQPICPKCGELGRSSDDYCSKCGTKLLPKAELNIDTGEVIPIE
jgi:hypothetical protein